MARIYNKRYIGQEYEIQNGNSGVTESVKNKEF